VKLEDTSPMPWGKYGPKPRGDGRLMADVPVNYFHWLWTEKNKKQDQSCPVADYIRRNLNVLLLENDDLIWD